MTQFILVSDENITFDSSFSPEDGIADIAFQKSNTVTVDDIDLTINLDATHGDETGLPAPAQTTINAVNDANIVIDSVIGYERDGASLTLNISDTSSIFYNATNISNLDDFDKVTVNFTGDDGAGLFKLQLPPESVYRSATLSGLSNGDSLIIEPYGSATGIGRVNWDAANSELHIDVLEPDGSLRPALTFKVEGDIPADATFENVGNGQITFKSPCYLRGTHIATSEGEKRIEDLQAGDQVLTVSGRLATVKWVGYFKLHSNRIPAQHATRAYPICITAGALAPNVPTRDLYVSPGHHMYFDGKLIPALQLVNGITITQDFSLRAFEYFHVELDRFDIILAEGAAAESYVDAGNRSAFQNVNIDSMLADFGPAKGRPTIDGIKVVRAGSVVHAVHQRLLERAETLKLAV